MFEVTLLDMGLMPECPACGVTMLSNLNRFRAWAYTALLARSETETVVINTGFPVNMGPVQAYFHDWHPRATVQRSPTQTIEAQLQRLGVDPARVDHLVLSCLGPYSTGRVELFTTATIQVGRSEWLDFLAPPPGFPPTPRDLILPPSTLQRLLTEDWPRVRLLDDEDHVVPGIRVLRTGGHHKGSLTVLIETARGVVAYADTIFAYENYEQNVPIGFLRNLDEFHAAVTRLRCEADIVVPFFDPAAFERHPGGRVA